MDNTFIPRRLNDGWKIAWFDLDVALPFVVSSSLASGRAKLGALALGGGKPGGDADQGRQASAFFALGVLAPALWCTHSSAHRRIPALIE
jgi:hypothetical protein